MRRPCRDRLRVLRSSCARILFRSELNSSKVVDGRASVEYDPRTSTMLEYLNAEVVFVQRSLSESHISATFPGDDVESIVAPSSTCPGTLFYRQETNKGSSPRCLLALISVSPVLPRNIPHSSARLTIAISHRQFGLGMPIC